jgi:hypothetical protein
MIISSHAGREWVLNPVKVVLIGEGTHRGAPQRRNLCDCGGRGHSDTATELPGPVGRCQKPGQGEVRDEFPSGSWRQTALQTPRVQTSGP